MVACTGASHCRNCVCLIDGTEKNGESADETGKKRNTKGTLLISVGLLLIAAALVLVLYNAWDAKRAEKASTAIVEKIGSRDFRSAVESVRRFIFE